MSRVFAYCRVSTSEQNTANQVQEIKSAGFDVQPHRIVAETISGSSHARQRPGLRKLRERLERGDVLVVTKLDRLGRNAVDVRQTVEELAGQGVRVHCLALGGVDLTSAAGKMTMQVINAVAEFELDLLKERTRSGMQRAVAQGVKVGRRASLDAEKAAKVRAQHAAGASVSTLSKEYGTSRQSIYRALAGPA